MVKVNVHGDRVVFEVLGWHRIWSLKRRLEVPLAHIKAVRAAPEVTLGWWHGLRAPGTHIPGVIVAGTFYKKRKRTFWDVRRPDRAVMFDLEGDRYDQIIVEVEDPVSVVAALNAARPGAHPGR